MENGFGNLLRKVKQEVSAQSKKVALFTGVALGVAGYQEVASQTVTPPHTQTTEWSAKDSVLYQKALALYQERIQNRDNSSKFNMMVDLMNQAAIEKGAWLSDKPGYQEKSTFDLKQVSLDVPTYITQKGAKTSTLGSALGFIKGTHEITFKESEYTASQLTNIETVTWKDFLNKYAFTYGEIDQENGAIKQTKDILSHYTNTQTGKTLDSEKIKMFGANAKSMYGVFPGGVSSVYGSEVESYQFLDAIVDLDNDALGTTIKEQLGKNASTASLAKVKTFFIDPKHPDLEPATVRVLSYQVIRSMMGAPFEKDAAEGKLTGNCHYDLSMYYICIPQWAHKKVPPVPNKEQFISNYIKQHQEDTVSIDTVQSVTPDTVAIHQEQQVSDTLKTVETTIQAAPSRDVSGGVLIKPSPNYPRLNEVYTKTTNPKTGLKQYTLDHYVDSSGNVFKLSADGVTPEIE